MYVPKGMNNNNNNVLPEGTGMCTVCVVLCKVEGRYSW
jgi:hypothetical protein